MNQKRLKSIQTVASTIRSMLADLETAKDEEQEAFDNLPEGLQQAEKGEAMEANVGTLEESISAIESALDDLDALS